MPKRRWFADLKKDTHWRRRKLRRSVLWHNVYIVRGITQLVLSCLSFAQCIKVAHVSRTQQLLVTMIFFLHKIHKSILVLYVATSRRIKFAGGYLHTAREENVARVLERRQYSDRCTVIDARCPPSCTYPRDFPRLFSPLSAYIFPRTSALQPEWVH